MKILYSPSMRKVIGIAVLLFILELNMIALYTYTMVDHNPATQNEGHHKPKESIVRVKRIMNAVTGLLPGSDQQDNLVDNGSGENNVNSNDKKPNNVTIKKTLVIKPEIKPHVKPKPVVKSKPVTLPPSRPKPHPKNPDRPSPEPPTIKLTRRPPTYVIMGAKCAGVSTLTQLMSLHPQIKLVNDTYWTLIHQNTTSKQNNKNMPAPKHGQILVDVSTDLLSTSSVARSLKRSVPNLKLILMLRDPLDRCLSCYHNSVSKLDGSGTRSFEDFILNSKGKINTQSELISDSVYDVHLTKWLREYNITHWLFMDYYQLSTQPYNTLRRLEKFLHVQPFYRRDDFAYNKQQLLCLSPKRLKKIKLPSLPPPHLCLQSNSSISEVSLGADIEDQLKEYFTPHMEKLLSLVSSQIYLGDLVSLMN